VSVLRQVKTPGLLRLSSDIRLIEGISRAGGITEGADLQGDLLVRNRQILPVDFDKLLRQGDSSQNALLRSNDLVLIPNIKDKMVFVLGEVSKLLVVTLTTLNVDAITKKADIAENVQLQSGHIVYVPKTPIANVVNFIHDLAAILSPVILAETGIVLYAQVKSVLETGAAQPQTVPPATPIVIGR